MMIPLINVAQDYDNNSFLLNHDLEQLNTRVVMEYFESDLPRSDLPRIIDNTNSWEDKSANKLNTCCFVEQQRYFDKWISLYQSFEDSFQKEEGLFSSTSFTVIVDSFKKSLSKILSISPEIISVGVSDDECVYLYFEKNDKSVYFDLFFEPEQSVEASVTVFENKVSRLSFSDSLNNSIDRLIKEFENKNELSCSAFAEI